MVVLAVAVSTIGWHAWSIYLPDPVRADGAALLRWLVLQELADQPRQRQILIVDRLAEQLNQGLPAAGNTARLSLSQRQRLARNLTASKRIWFETRVDRYAAIPAAEQWEFVNAQVATVLRWADLSAPAAAAEIPAGADECETRHDATMQFFDELERWVAEADSDRAARMRQAVQAGLTCWLATRDLAVEPLATRREIARRIVAELESGLELEQAASDLTDEHRDILRANGLLLMEAWLSDEAARYAELPADERTDYVDARLDQVEGWGLFQFLSGPAGPPASGGEQSAPVSLMTQVNVWIDRAEPARQPHLRALVADLQRRLLWRSLQALLN
jgi:hypothetical protein